MILNDPKFDKSEPESIEWADGHTLVKIQWEEGHLSRYRLDYLRQICPCAVCADLHSQPPISPKPAAPKKLSFNVLNDAQASLAKSGARVKKAYPIGNYAMGLEWADGHDAGIYSWRYLRGMCPCQECAERAKADQEAENIESEIDPA